MKFNLMFIVLLVLIVGCTTNQKENIDVVQNTPITNFEEITDTNEVLEMNNFILNDEDLDEIGLTYNGTECEVELYRSSETTYAQGSTCLYFLDHLENSTVYVIMNSFVDFDNLNGSFLYNALHYRGYVGLESKNDYGDFSLLYGSNESMVYYYHLYIGQYPYLIHITSKGVKDDLEYVKMIGEKISTKIDAKGDYRKGLIRSQKIAKNLLENSEDYNGDNNVVVKNIKELKCEGCFVVEMEYYGESLKDPSMVDLVTVVMTLNQWEVVDTVVGRGVVEGME